MTHPRILIVEDEAILALGLEARLKLLGYEVVGSAENAAEALELALARRPDLILMDIRLRGAEDGILAADRIRKQLGLPVIFLSAFSDEETLRRAKVTEPFGYLIKPCQDRELRATIEMALHKHASEARLRESERRSAATLGSIGDGVLAADEAGRITLLNEAAQRITGWTEAEALGRPASEVFRLIHPTRREPVPCPVARAIRERRVVRIPEGAILIARDGREVTVEDTAAPIAQDDSPPLGAVVAFRDVTDRRRAERNLLHEQKAESLGVLAGGIAHDFNNLLTPIVGYASLLKEVVAEDSATAMIERIESSVRRAEELTSQMLAYAGRGRFAAETVCLNRLARDVASDPTTRLPAGAELRLDLGENLPPLAADRAQLTRMLLNLLTNASEALGESPGTITVRTRPDGTQIVLEVADTGCGMSQEVAQRVLDPFFTTKFTGRGLGLAAVQGIVRSHRGTLSLHSALGKGTTFRVLLPVNRPTPPETTVQRTPPAPARGRVLIVDDEYAIRLFMERSLTMAGFQVHSAGDGFAAIEHFATHAAEIDLVILDMMMPKMGGREVAERLVEYRPDVKLILMSGYSEGDVQQQFADLPLVAVLNKPFNPKRLIEIVRESLGMQVAVGK